MGVEIVPFLFTPAPGTPFDLTKFFMVRPLPFLSFSLPLLFSCSRNPPHQQPLLTPEVDDFESEIPLDIPRVYEGDIADELDSFLFAIRTKEAVKRKAFSVPFVLGDGTVIGVNG